MMDYVITKYVTDNTPFTMNARVDLKPHFLYYGNTQLTDKKCIKTVYVCTENGTLANTGRQKVYCQGPVEVGDYLTTSEMFGVATKIVNRDFAFAKVIAAKDGYKTLLGKKYHGKVGLVDVVFL